MCGPQTKMWRCAWQEADTRRRGQFENHKVDCHKLDRYLVSEMWQIDAISPDHLDTRDIFDPEAQNILSFIETLFFPHFSMVLKFVNGVDFRLRWKIGCWAAEWNREGADLSWNNGSMKANYLTMTTLNMEPIPWISAHCCRRNMFPNYKQSVIPCSISKVCIHKY